MNLTYSYFKHLQYRFNNDEEEDHSVIEECVINLKHTESKNTEITKHFKSLKKIHQTNNHCVKHNIRWKFSFFAKFFETFLIILSFKKHLKMKILVRAKSSNAVLFSNS